MAVQSLSCQNELRDFDLTGLFKSRALSVAFGFTKATLTDRIFQGLEVHQSVTLKKHEARRCVL